jgi:hypothetical protein
VNNPSPFYLMILGFPIPVPVVVLKMNDSTVYKTVTLDKRRVGADGFRNGAYGRSTHSFQEYQVPVHAVQLLLNTVKEKKYYLTSRRISKRQRIVASVCITRSATATKSATGHIAVLFCLSVPEPDTEMRTQAPI